MCVCVCCMYVGPGISHLFVCVCMYVHMYVCCRYVGNRGPGISHLFVCVCVYVCMYVVGMLVIEGQVFHICLCSCLQDMVSKVSTLLKTVKNVEDESSKGIQSLENTIDAIEAGLSDYSDPSKAPESKVNPEELIRSTKVSLACLE